MDKTLRSILWVLVALVLLSSFSTGWFFVAKERLYDRYIDLGHLFKTSMERSKKELAVSNKKNMELATKLSSVKKEMDILESKNKELETRYKEALKEKEGLDSNLAMVRKARFFLEKKLKERESDSFVAGILKEKVLAEVELERLKGSLAPKDLEITKLKQDNMNLEVALSKLKEEKDSLKEKLGDSTKVAQILSSDLLKEKGSREKDKKVFERTRVENRVLKTRLAELEKISDKFDNLAAEKNEIQSKISSLMRDVESKDKEISKLKLALGHKVQGAGELRAEAYHAPGEVELPPIVLKGKGYTAGEGAAVASGISLSLKGRIVSVNREHNFVVIDLGKQDGIGAGNVFEVYRAGLAIGSIKVIQTRQRIAAADIKDLKEGFHVEVSDIIARQ